ncbi:ceramide glucosyltransferase [[Candida] anglica]|uniref:Ceramide glucosyltransferase n=1 Tax=[Candida] anglica TaxID=148631 RepID=A0ABP0EBG2_9ASCO
MVNSEAIDSASSVSTARYLLACVLFVTYLVILGVAYNGVWQIMLNFRYSKGKKTRQEREIGMNESLEGVSIIRPLKGIDPEMSSCLESSFVQDYPSDRFEILFCVDDPNDTCIPIVESLLKKHSHISARILVSQNYNEVSRTSDEHFGPNPKVNNLAKGFLAAKYDIVWVMDSNVWASSRVLKRSVRCMQQNIDNGRPVHGKRSVKLVHHAPMAISVADTEYSLSPISSGSNFASSGSNGHHKRILKKFGAKLDEMFLLTSHAKFYTSFNNLSVAPCVNGKSNLYRRSDLDHAVSQIPKRGHSSAFFNSPEVLKDAFHFTSLGPGHAIKFFSRYIGEDNMIAICLWENVLGRTGMTGDVVVQPLSGEDNSVNDYFERRTRWLRVRKYMVLAATLLEPATESILSGIYGNFAITTLFGLGAKDNQYFYWPLFLIHMSIWITTDYIQYYVLIDSAVHSDKLELLPAWMDSKSLPPLKRSFFDWSLAWLGRELLALPIWVAAIVGHEIDWRGRPFRIKQDLTAEEL